MKPTTPMTGNPKGLTAPGGTVELLTGHPTCAGPIPAALAHMFQPPEKIPFPEFSKLPSPRERCPWTGASRSWILDMEKAGRVKIVRVRQPGKMRGACFVYLPSLLELLRGEMEGGQNAN